MGLVVLSSVVLAQLFVGSNSCTVTLFCAACDDATDFVSTGSSLYQ